MRSFSTELLFSDGAGFAAGLSERGTGNAVAMAKEYNGEAKVEFLVIVLLFLDSVIHYRTIHFGERLRQRFVEKAREALDVRVHVMDSRPEKATNMFKFLFQQCMLAVCRPIADLTRYQCYHG